MNCCRHLQNSTAGELVSRQKEVKVSWDLKNMIPKRNRHFQHNTVEAAMLDNIDTFCGHAMNIFTSFRHARECENGDQI